MNQKPSNHPPQPSPAKVKADGGLLRSSGVVSFFTMLSRVLGLARDIIFARVIGAEALADVFFVAFKIPNFFRRLFAEGAFAQAFVPVLGEYRQNGSQAALKELVNRVFGTLGMALLILTLVIVSCRAVFCRAVCAKVVSQRSV